MERGKSLFKTEFNFENIIILQYLIFNRRNYFRPSSCGFVKIQYLRAVQIPIAALARLQSEGICPLTRQTPDEASDRLSISFARWQRHKMYFSTLPCDVFVPICNSKRNNEFAKRLIRATEFEKREFQFQREDQCMEIAK